MVSNNQKVSLTHITEEQKMSNFFEKKIVNYSSNFDMLDRIVKNQAEASNYYAWVRDGYKTYFTNTESSSISKFYIRYYRAKKLLYSSAQMLAEAKESIENECVVSFYYLIYYALFQAMQANILLCIHYDDNKVLQLSHDNVKTYFNVQFCKNNKCPIDNEIISLFEDLRSYREYYSYAKPFNLSSETIVDIGKVEQYIRLCTQLFNLHCWIIWQDVKKHFEFDSSKFSEIKTYFNDSCNRLKGDVLTDAADTNVWSEFKEYKSGEVLPLLITYEHDFDEYGTYDNSTYQAMQIPRTGHIISEALKFIYNSI